MAVTLKIKDWEERFCPSQAKRVVRWSWVGLPINLTGNHYRQLIASPEGREAYSVFVALVCVAANMPVRGVLADKDGPLSLQALFHYTGIPEKALEQGISLLSSKEIGWLTPHRKALREPSEKSRRSLGERSEHAPRALGDTLPNPTQPNPTRHDITKTTPSPAAKPELKLVDTSGSGGRQELTEESLRRFLRVININHKVAERIVFGRKNFPAGFGMPEVNKEWARLASDKNVTSPEGAMVTWLCGLGGIDLDMRSAAHDVQRAVNDVRSARYGSQA